MTNEQINELAEDALNVLCLYVQERLGINTGDIAGEFWSDDNYRNLIRDYVKTEVMWLKD